MLGMALNSQFTFTQNHVPPFQGQLISSLLKYLQRNLVLLSPRRFQHVAQVVMLCKTKNIHQHEAKEHIQLGVTSTSMGTAHTHGSSARPARRMSMYKLARSVGCLIVAMNSIVSLLSIELIMQVSCMYFKLDKQAL